MNTDFKMEYCRLPPFAFHDGQSAQRTDISKVSDGSIFNPSEISDGRILSHLLFVSQTSFDILVDEFFVQRPVIVFSSDTWIGGLTTSRTDYTIYLNIYTTRPFILPNSNQSNAMMQLQSELVPRYYQLKLNLEKRIQSGEFQPGDQFLTEDVICAEYALSRGTVRHAIDMLVEEGRLRREQGRGTFVTNPNLNPIFFRLSSFDEEMEQRGRKPSTKLLHLKVNPATHQIAADLGVRLGEDVIEIARLRLADGQPMAFETRFLAYKTCPELVNEDLENQSIHNLLIDKFNIPLVRAKHTIEARVLSEREAALLHTTPGSAGFSVSRVTYTTQDQPVTVYHIIYRGDEYRFTAEF